MRKLTIITINFNHAEGLKRTIDSIINQTFTDYEWIVVDGGSTDGSKELIEQNKDHFSWWCSEPDKGVYNAMNKGLAHATGEYVNFMNSGDTFATPTILEEIFSKPRTADILYGRAVLETGNEEKCSLGINNELTHCFEIYNQNLCHQSEFTKRALYEVKLFDEKYRVYADWDWNAFMIACKRCSTLFLPKIVAIYEGGGLSEKQKIQAIDELSIIRNKYFACLTRDDIIDFKYLSVIKRYMITDKLFFILSRIANRYRKLLKNE